MLSNNELARAFLLGCQVFLFGCAFCIVSLIPKYFSLQSLWFWGLSCCVAGIAIAVSSIIFTALNIWREERKLEEPKIIYRESDHGDVSPWSLSHKPIITCFSCKYYHGLTDVHCAVHPYGKKFEDCEDFEM